MKNFRSYASNGNINKLKEQPQSGRKYSQITIIQGMNRMNIRNKQKYKE